MRQTVRLTGCFHLGDTGRASADQAKAFHFLLIQSMNLMSKIASPARAIRVQGAWHRSEEAPPMKHTGVKLFIGAKDPCMFCLEICTPEGRGGEKGGSASFKTKHTEPFIPEYPSPVYMCQLYHCFRFKIDLVRLLLCSA